MILMLGPAGAGKSLQGQILALRHGWKWFSMGAALRQHATPEIQVLLDQGKIVPNHITNDLAARLFHEEADLRHLIVDGYPRNMEQAGYLVDYLSGRDGDSPNVVMVLDIGKEELPSDACVSGDVRMTMTRRLPSDWRSSLEKGRR